MAKKTRKITNNIGPSPIDIQSVKIDLESNGFAEDEPGCN